MSSFACENIHEGQERINVESWGRKEINLCLAALLCDNLLPIRESFDFTVEWFADFELFASTGEELVWKYNEPLISQLSDTLQRTMHILNHLQQIFYLFPHSFETSKLKSAIYSKY